MSGSVTALHLSQGRMWRSWFSSCLFSQRTDRWTHQRHSIRATTSAFNRSPAPVLGTLFLKTYFYTSPFALKMEATGCTETLVPFYTPALWSFTLTYAILLLHPDPRQQCCISRRGLQASNSRTLTHLRQMFVQAIYKNTVPTPQRAHSMSFIVNLLMFQNVICFYCKSRVKHKNSVE